MSNAEQILMAAGVVAIAWGMILGIPLAQARGSAPAASRHLVNAHLEGLMVGPLLIAISYAFAATGFDSGVSTVGAVLLVAGALANAAGNTTNWLMGTGDQFAERSPGLMLNSLSSPLMLAGIAIAAVGVLANL